MTPTAPADERESLLRDYAVIARRRGPRALEGTALRSRSTELRELHAYLASDGTLTYDELVEVLEHGGRTRLDPLWTASLGRTVALQNIDDEDRALGRRLLEHGYSAGLGAESPVYSKLLTELYLEASMFKKAHALLKKEKSFEQLDHGNLYTDLINPFRKSEHASLEEWTDRFARPFTAAGLEAPSAPLGSSNPFNALRADAPAGSVTGPLVTVILTSFKPVREDVLHSARSILNQTYRDIELLVVDDASPAEYDATLAELAALDSRVRVLKVEENGGTYLARNLGIEEAQGDFVTCQDADDWSHPRRIEHQVAPLLADVALPGTRSRCITVLEDLTTARPGYRPDRPNASSLMFRRSDALALGGFVRSRRAADSEFHHRLEKKSGLRVLTIDMPLALVRILAASLSRSDFLSGWSHPARRAFVDSYRLWHETATDDQLDAGGPDAPIVPSRFAIRPAAEVKHFDVVFAGDWRSFGGPQKSMMEEIRALRAGGLRVGILHMEAARFMTWRAEHLCVPIQEMINAGEIERVLSDETATVDLLVLRYPPILQFAQHSSVTLDIRRLVILANQAPTEKDGSDRRYIVEDCHRTAERLFGTAPLWVPQGPVVRTAIRDSVPDGHLAAFDMPGILDLDDWRTDRSYFRSDRPVVGRHSRDHRMKWPATARELRSAYPVDGRYDVRIMGGISSARSVLGSRTTPVGWVAFDKDELEVKTFLNSLDFYVNFTHHEANEAFGRAILEALAAGCVTILPESFRDTFGDAALYAEASQTQRTINEVYADLDWYRELSSRAVAHVRANFSHESYRLAVADLMALDCIPAAVVPQTGEQPGESEPSEPTGDVLPVVSR
jgi:glycosyltransferase involved in cell wall biosynthesis